MILRNSLAMLAAGVTLLVGNQVAAVPITINNPGFEDPAQADGGFTTGLITGWVAPGAQGVFNPTTAQIAVVPEGVQVGYSNGGSITQMLSASLTADTQYTLTVQVGRRNDGCCGNPLFTMDLLAGGAVLNSNSISYLTLAPGPFVPVTVTYLAVATDPHLGQSLSIRITSDGAQSDFDNVVLDAQTVGGRVPEPTTLLLLGSGMLALVVRSRPR
jgi:hypothetical protein